MVYEPNLNAYDFVTYRNVWCVTGSVPTLKIFSGSSGTTPLLSSAVNRIIYSECYTWTCWLRFWKYRPYEIERRAWYRGRTPRTVKPHSTNAMITIAIIKPRNYEINSKTDGRMVVVASLICSGKPYREIKINTVADIYICIYSTDNNVKLKL